MSFRHILPFFLLEIDTTIGLFFFIVYSLTLAIIFLEIFLKCKTLHKWLLRDGPIQVFLYVIWNSKMASTVTRYQRFFLLFVCRWKSWFHAMGGRMMVFNISVISWQSVLLVEETGKHRENHWPATNHWQTLSHNVVMSITRHEWDSNSQR